MNPKLLTAGFRSNSSGVPTRVAAESPKPYVNPMVRKQTSRNNVTDVSLTQTTAQDLENSIINPSNANNTQRQNSMVSKQ